MKKIWMTVCLLPVLILVLFAQAVFAGSDADTLQPYGLEAKLMTADETHPYGSALLTFKINGLPRSSDSAHWEVDIEKKIGNGAWTGIEAIPSDSMLDQHQQGAGVFTFEQLWLESYAWDGTTQISYRVYVRQYDYTWSGVGQSAYSNTATLGLKSSAWAVAELQEAEALGLIPAILQGKDLTKPVTREEFCELAVLLYEKSAGKAALPAESNPFTDTDNAQILKAFRLEITKGVSESKFEPNTLINREQCAAMLFRTITAIAPEGNYSVAGVKDFPDQRFISAWAVDATKYMSKINIIKGDAQGNFMPKATTTAQQAAGYGMATREAAVLMVVRAYGNVK